MIDFEIPRRPWTPKERGLISWYRSMREKNRFPIDPFKLAPFMFVFVPERFYESLDLECSHEMAETLRSTRNALAYDLGMLYRHVEGEDFHEDLQDLFSEAPEEGHDTEALQTVPLLFE